MWGKAFLTTPFAVNGQKVQVTMILAYALQDVFPLLFKNGIPPDKPPSGRIWADAACMNQADTGEESSSAADDDDMPSSKDRALMD